MKAEKKELLNFFVFSYEFFSEFEIDICGQFKCHYLAMQKI